MCIYSRYIYISPIYIHILYTQICWVYINWVSHYPYFRKCLLENDFLES